MRQFYTYDNESRVYRRNASTPISYSDGDQTEVYLLNKLKSAKDLSSKSAELHAAIRDWPSEYHLSLNRHNLLRPFTLNKTDEILELGCGCGAISRYLGEVSTRVVAVEGSQRRAEIAAERCRDLSNVSIICDNIIDFTTDEKFDVVTLIGVLEYARVFIETRDPIHSCLEHARSFLKDNGVLIVAIENQLGLKYLNGSAEDHTGIPYFGINDRYSEKSPVTFGRRELATKLTQANFTSYYFCYPFPDYKMPRFILSQEAFDHPEFRIEDFFCELGSKDYSGLRYRSFHENRAWRVIARNGMIQDLSNSFLVFASATPAIRRQLRDKSWLAAAYATDRHPTYATQTLFVQHDRGSIKVIKERIFCCKRTSLDGTISISHLPNSSSKYFQGQLLLAEFQQLMATEGDVSGIMQSWLDFLWTNSDAPGNPKAKVPGEFLDCIPHNIVRDIQGRYHFFDAEWVSEEPIPLAWVVVRGTIFCICASIVPDRYKNMCIRDITQHLIAIVGINLSDDDLRSIVEMETKFQELVYGRPVINEFTEFIDLSVGLEENIHWPIYNRKTEQKRKNSENKMQLPRILRFIRSIQQKFIGRL